MARQGKQEAKSDVVTDPLLGGYFKGMSLDTERRVRQLAVDFVAANTGGPVVYTGRSMKIAHGGLGISESDYDALMRHAATALTKVGVDDREKAEMLPFLARFRGDCVEGR